MSPAPVFPAPYVPVKELGAGAAGVVYLVRNTARDRLEALKLLKPAGSKEATDLAAARFLREARAMQLLSHPSIVATFDSGLLADGQRYLTMEYVQGPSLHQLLQRRGPLSITLALGILAEAADAIHHAHEAGVVHRDLKPHNVLLDPHPHGHQVRILDFGLSKIFGLPDSGPQLTRDGAVFGTPAYMSPEQARGGVSDRRTDIYALGCIGYEMLVGVPPFRGGIAELFAAHVLEPPRAPSTVDPEAVIPPAADAVILRCLAKQPADRFQTGADLCAALQAIAAYRPLRTPPRS